MSGTAELPVGPWARLKGMGPHEIAGRQFYARPEDLPTSISLRYDTDRPTRAQFEFNYASPLAGGEALPAWSGAAEAVRPVIVDLFFENGSRLHRVVFTVTDHAQLFVGEDMLKAVRWLPHAVAAIPRDMMERSMIVSAVGATTMLSFVASKLLLELQARLKGST